MAVIVLRWLIIPVLFLAFCQSLPAGGFELLSPLDHQVIQRAATNWFQGSAGSA